MTGAGRNDPCPCGSGRKFKKCCLGKSDAATAVYTREEREVALGRVARLAASQELAHVREDATVEFWAGWIADRSDDEVEEAFALQQSSAAFNEWFWLDHRLPGGSSIVELL